VTGTSINAMKEQAKTFYQRAAAYKPTCWFLDIEQPATMPYPQLANGVETFRATLSKLGAKNIGLYSTAAFLSENSINASYFNVVWLADYGQNTGTWNSSPQTNLNYQIQQYTSMGRLAGYNGDLDLNRLTSSSAYQQIFFPK
jgi:GH25 family lysozyme M1 (1,4-beta-N-acetylmuramidase)